MTFLASKTENVWTYYVNGKAAHAPTLKTILEVERVIRDAGEPLQREEIKRRLKKKIMHQTLNIIIRYLDERGLVLDSHKGVVWIYNDNKRLIAAIERGRRV